MVVSVVLVVMTVGNASGVSYEGAWYWLVISLQ